jgi:serine/threonine protein kinase/tetratricopeptide (TPR) repeat protein
VIGRTISHYRVQARIGSGAMGDVYRAHDTRLHRAVALKFLKPGKSDATGRRRFLHEARAASALDHANICTIYDTGETADGQLYLVMAFYEGLTLAERIRRGPFTIEELARVGTQIAAGLSRAHQYGIVHRDIKPANLLITSFGELKILDFGIAKLRGYAGANEEGIIRGTLSYMSPEQVNGTSTDFRTDIWSLGVVLYEMLTQRRPFAAEDMERRIAEIVYEDPPEIGTLRPGVPPVLAGLIERCLRKSADMRVQSCQEIQEVLSDTQPPRPPAPRVAAALVRPRWSILVMPFTSVDSDDDAHLGHGVAEEVITALSHVSALRVMARTASERVQQGGGDLTAAARELGVDYIIAGAIRRESDALWISANVVNVRGGTLLWAEQFSGTIEEIFSIQEQLARQIAEALSVHLNTQEREHHSDIRLADLQSYDYYLRAKREFVRYDPGGLERALTFIESARARVGDNVLLLAAAGQIFWQIVNSGSSADRRYLEKARECADRLLAIDPDGPHGPRLLGMVWATEGRIRESIASLERAVVRDPFDTDTLSLLGPLYGYVGRPQLGMPYVTRLLELDPLMPMYQALPGYLFLMAGSFDNAAAAIGRSYRMDPGNPVVSLSYGQCLALNGQTAEAITVFDDLQRQMPGAFMSRLGQLYKCALLNNREEAASWVTAEVEAIAEWDMYHAWNLAECFAMLGEPERAMHWLAKAVERGMLNYPLLAHLDPFLENIRSDPQFTSLMTAVRRQWEEFSTALPAGLPA